VRSADDELRSAVSLLREVDELFDRHFGVVRARPAVWEPPLDLFLDGDRVCLVFELPGVAARDMDIRVGHRVVLVTGTRRSPGRAGARFYESEIARGAFRRVVRLPMPVIPDSYSIRMEQGVLSLEFEQSSAKVRIVEVE
jgi:HSP20 family protein